MLLYNIESIAKKMAIDYKEVTNHIEHMGVRGGYRESILRKYIEQLLPKKFAVGNGIITDANGTQSKQQDFFAYDAFNSPVFLNMESSCVIPVESVYATVEIKSTLTRETLRQSIENIKSVKDLNITILKNSFIVPSQSNFILGTIFSYTSDSVIETVAQNVNELCKDVPKEKQPSMICILDKGLIVNVSKEGMKEIVTNPSDSTMWGIVENTDELNLYLYYLILQQHLNTTINFPPDLLKYAEAAHIMENMNVSIPRSMIPNDMFIEAGKSKISGEKIKDIFDNHELFLKSLAGDITEEDLQKHGKSIEDLKGDNEKIVSFFKQIVEENKVCE